MTSLSIVPNLNRKSARFAGNIAAGEHVAVTIEGLGGIAGSPTLFLRVMFGPMTIAQFPQPVHEGETPEPWIAVGDNLQCELNLNTVQALKTCRGPETDCLFVLEDIGSETTEPTLYFAGVKLVMGWPQKRLFDRPFDLGEYPGLIACFAQQLDNIELSVTKVGPIATISMTDRFGHVTTATIEDGATGAQGPSGNTGEKGEKGDKGDPGEKGDPGDVEHVLVGEEFDYTNATARKMAAAIKTIYEAMGGSVI